MTAEHAHALEQEGGGSGSTNSRTKQMTVNGIPVGGDKAGLQRSN